MTTTSAASGAIDSPADTILYYAFAGSAGQAITFTVTVAPSPLTTVRWGSAPAAKTTVPPSGTVSLVDGGPIGVCTLVGGICSVTTSSMPVGSHLVTATYSGDSR